MRLVKYNPWRDMLDLEDRVNRMFRDLAPHRVQEESLIGNF